MLDRGVPLRIVADRCGHDPLVLLRSYANRTRKGDTKADEAIQSWSAGSPERMMMIVGGGLWVQFGSSAAAVAWMFWFAMLLNS